MSITRVGAAVLTLFGLACTAPTEPQRQVVELQTDQAAYAIGDTLRLTLMNRGPQAIGPGNAAASLFCRVEVEREQPPKWEHIATLGGACILVGLPPLGSGASVEREFALTPESFVAPGSYRLHVTVGVTGQAPFLVHSNSFTVTPDLR